MSADFCRFAAWDQAGAGFLAARFVSLRLPFGMGPAHVALLFEGQLKEPLTQASASGLIRSFNARVVGGKDGVVNAIDLLVGWTLAVRGSSPAKIDALHDLFALLFSHHDHDKAHAPKTPAAVALTFDEALLCVTSARRALVAITGVGEPPLPTRDWWVEALLRKRFSDAIPVS
jgi:hypothetical protein